MFCWFSSRVRWYPATVEVPAAVFACAIDAVNGLMFSRQPAQQVAELDDRLLLRGPQGVVRLLAAGLLRGERGQVAGVGQERVRRAAPGGRGGSGERSTDRRPARRRYGRRCCWRTAGLLLLRDHALRVAAVVLRARVLPTLIHRVRAADSDVAALPVGAVESVLRDLPVVEAPRG
jgi:hypothetical protein